MLEVLEDIAFDTANVGPLRKGLKRLAAALGVVRDAEVWLESVAEYAARLPEAEQAGLDPLRERLHTMRDVGREDLLATLGSKRTARLLKQLETFVTTEGVGLAKPEHFSPRVRDAAGSALWSRLEAVQIFEIVMPEAPLPLLHELRISCKKLRYTIELFEGALPEDAGRMHEELVAAQDHLGSLHDADVALPFVDEFLDQEPHNLALSHYRTHLEQTRDRLWSSVPELWMRIGSKEFRVRLANIIASL
jgi:CHAD domain-containing protein